MIHPSKTAYRVSRGMCAKGQDVIICVIISKQGNVLVA